MCHAIRIVVIIVVVIIVVIRIIRDGWRRTRRRLRWRLRFGAKRSRRRCRGLATRRYGRQRCGRPLHAIELERLLCKSLLQLLVVHGTTQRVRLVFQRLLTHALHILHHLLLEAQHISKRGIRRVAMWKAWPEGCSCRRWSHDVWHAARRGRSANGWQTRWEMWPSRRKSRREWLITPRRYHGIVRLTAL